MFFLFALHRTHFTLVATKTVIMYPQAFAAVVLLLQVHSCQAAPTKSNELASNQPSWMACDSACAEPVPIQSTFEEADGSTAMDASPDIPIQSNNLARSIPDALDESDSSLKLPPVHIPIPVWDEEPAAAQPVKRSPASTLENDCNDIIMDRRDLDAVRRCLGEPLGGGTSHVAFEENENNNPFSTVPTQSTVKNGTNTTSTAPSSKSTPANSIKKIPEWELDQDSVKTDADQGSATSKPRALHQNSTHIDPKLGDNCGMMDRRGNVERMVCPFPFHIGTTVIGQAEPLSEGAGEVTNVVDKRNTISWRSFNFTSDGWLDCPLVARRDNVVYRRCSTEQHQACDACEGTVSPADLTAVDKRHVLLPGESPDPECTGPLCAHIVDF